eukprot:SAG31_NODE_16_length_36206_cov_27.355728_8_plen_160_part_00
MLQVRTGPADLDGSAVSFADYSAAFSAHERTVQPSIRLDWRNCLIAESMEETQHITRADMNKGQIRIPARVVQAMRMSSGRFQFEFETGTVTAAFRDGKSADLRTRSGTIAVGKVQMRTLVWHNQVVEGEKMRIVRESDSVFKLSRRSYAAAMADAPLQ